MSESPYAIPEDDLLDTARVPLADQVVEQPERRLFDTRWADGGNHSGDVDGDGD